MPGLPVINTIVNKIVFLILFSDHSLLVHKNITDFLLILYLVTFLNSLFFKCFRGLLVCHLHVGSSTLAWRIPWMEEPGRLQSMGLRRVRRN